MVITLTGVNTFAWRSALSALTGTFVQTYGDMGVERLDGEEVSYERLQESLQSPPFLAAKKLVILQSPSAHKRFIENAERLLTELPDSTEVVIVEPKLDQRSRYFTYLKKSTDFQDFPALKGDAVVRWLVATAKQKGARLSPADAQYLAVRVGVDQQLLDNELEKLSVYEPTISRAAIDLLSEPTPQTTIFELLEAAFGGDTKRAIALYSDQREQKVDPSAIIALLAWQLKVFALIKTAGDRSIEAIAREAKLNPYVVRKSYAMAKRLSFGKLKSLTAKLVAIDARSKRQNIDLDEALQTFLLTITN